ncbi:single-stranded DNA-binding protein [Aeoliella sp.]|uniref:single-stranded DNA-binding protein n=1 Tax=Aeoliella sp. TaxID=2795800 RepID=UPI003CCBFBDC
MAQHFSRVDLVGNLTATPTYIQAGEKKVAIAEGGIAVERPSKNGSSAGVDFVDFVAFDALADVVRELPKGTAVKIEGILRQDRWTNDQGQKRSRLKVVAKRVYVLQELAAERQGEA